MKKGFTLIELLSVIVILGLIALVSISSVLSSIKKGKNDLYNSQLKLIESGAISFVSEYITKKDTSFSESGTKIKQLINSHTPSDNPVDVKLTELQANGNVEYNVSNPLCNGKDKYFSPVNTVIRIRYDGYDFTYEITYKNEDGTYDKEKLETSCTSEVIRS